MVIKQMFKGKFYYFSFRLLCLFFLQSFIYAQTPTQIPENISKDNDVLKSTNSNPGSIAMAKENLIHLGDLIDVDVIGSTEYDWRGGLTPEGFLNGVDFVEEPIYALCRSEEEVASDIAKGYSKIFKNPQIAVKIVDRSGRPVSLLYGAVKTPQRFQIRRPVHLNELLILTGGITEKASGEIQILRPPNINCDSKQSTKDEQTVNIGQPQEINVSTKQNDNSQNITVKISDLIKGKQEANPLILSGDVVTVLETEPIYVMGGVANPKQINASSKMTLSRAIAAAGGFTKDANRKKVTVQRREKNGTQTIEVDFERIKAGLEKDIVLQAFDIVEIARSGYEKRKFSAIIKTVEVPEKPSMDLPLRIID